MQNNNIKLQLKIEYDILLMVINMKENIIKWAFFGVCFLAVAAIITGAVILKTKQNAMDKHLIELNYKELKEKVDNKESFILVVTQSQCSYCKEYKPVLKEVLYENDIYAYFIEKDRLTNEEKAKFNEIANVETTPQTLFFVDGAEESTQQRLVGNHPKNDIITKLKVKGYIK
jgi:predicted bacteriocin transport accessory protein